MQILCVNVHSYFFMSDVSGLVFKIFSEKLKTENKT